MGINYKMSLILIKITYFFLVDLSNTLSFLIPILLILKVSVSINY